MDKKRLKNTGQDIKILEISFTSHKQVRIGCSLWKLLSHAHTCSINPRKQF